MPTTSLTRKQRINCVRTSDGTMKKDASSLYEVLSQ